MVYIHQFIVKVSLAVIVHVISWKELNINNFSELTKISLDILFCDGIRKFVNVNLMLRETSSCWNLNSTQINSFELKKLSFYFWCCFDKSVISIILFGKDNRLGFEVALWKDLVQCFSDGLSGFGISCVLNIRK
jgi:hypothetical protein